MLIQERGINLDAFVSPERRERIVRDAPPEYEVQGVTLHVLYQRSKALVREYRPKDITAITEEVFLPDGRHILFVHEGRHLNLMQLQAHLQIGKFAGGKTSKIAKLA